MYILWEPYKDGYTVKDTKDGAIEYFPKPILRRLFRKGIEIKGITCDEKNVIHFNAQHSKAALKKQSSAIKAKLLLSGKVEIVESTKKVYFNLDGTEGAFKVPFIGDYQYVIKLNGLGSIASQPYGLYFDDAIKNISFGISDMLDVIVKIPKSATYIGFYVDNVRQLAIDFNYTSIAHCGKIDANCDVRILNYTAGSIYYPDSSRLSTYANVWLEVPKGITHLILDYLQFIPSVLQIPKHVKTFSTNSTYCRITSRTKGEYTKASDYLKRASYAYSELFNKPDNMQNFQHKARNYLFNEENIDVFKEAPYIIIVEDPRVTKLDTDLRGVVLVVPKGTRSYIGENVDFRYNIIVEV